VGIWTQVGPRNQVVDEVQIAPSEGASFREKDMPGHARRQSALICANMAERIEVLPFGCGLEWAQGSIFYMGAHCEYD